MLFSHYCFHSVVDADVAGNLKERYWAYNQRKGYTQIHF